MRFLQQAGRRAQCLLALLLSAGSTAALAQAYTPPPPPLDAPCKPTKKDPCTAPASTTPPAKPTMAFPFPGDTSDAVKLDPNASPNDPGNAPATPPSSSDKDSTGKYPFPSDVPPSGSSSSSSSSRAGNETGPVDPSTAPDDEDTPNPVASSRRRLPKVEDTTEREAKDVEVSQFYFSTGDYNAAYSRARDAVKLDSTDPEAHFALAEAARRLNKLDEARAEYNQSLKLDLTEKRARVARDQLAKLQ